MLSYHFHINYIILTFAIVCIPCAVTFENLKLYKCRTTERVTLEEISTREKNVQCKIMDKMKFWCGNMDIACSTSCGSSVVTSGTEKKEKLSVVFIVMLDL